MDLQEIRCTYQMAMEQINVLDEELVYLLNRYQQALAKGNNSEFDYLQFKITIIQGVIKMYEQYRDTKWTELQRETAKALREVLQGQLVIQGTPMTPPVSPPEPSSPSEMDSSSDNDTPTHSREMELSDNEFYMIPAPLSPIRDMNDFMITPPDSPNQSVRQADDYHYYSDSLFADMPELREF